MIRVSPPLHQGYITPVSIRMYFPDGCFVYHYDFEPSNSRCSRNVLPMFVKSINGVLYKMGANGEPISYIKSQVGYYVARTFEEARDEYKKLVDDAFIKRREYLAQALLDIDILEKSTIAKFNSHIFK